MKQDEICVSRITAELDSKPDPELRGGEPEDGDDGADLIARRARRNLAGGIVSQPQSHDKPASGGGQGFGSDFSPSTALSKSGWSSCFFFLEHSFIFSL